MSEERDLIISFITEENPTQDPDMCVEVSPDDTVERLVSLATCGAFNRKEAGIMLRAADEIVRLRGELENVQRDRMAAVENERLRDENAALKAELDRITPVLNYLLDGN